MFRFNSIFAICVVIEYYIFDYHDVIDGKELQSDLASSLCVFSYCAFGFYIHTVAGSFYALSPFGHDAHDIKANEHVSQQRNARGGSRRALNP